MTNRHRLWVDHAGGRIALARWGEANSGKPPALLVHGTGFVAEVWDEVAREMVSKYTVYGIDRRGHGASYKPSAETEAAMLGDRRGDGTGLFRRRTRQSLRLVIKNRMSGAIAEKSWPIYKEMSDRSVALIPGASQWTFEGVGHCVAQEAPGLVIEALAAF